MLTDLVIKNAKPSDKQYKLSDGRGLHLLVHPSGGKYWQVRYRINGKENTESLGTYPDVSLGAARDGRETLRSKIRNGVNPAEERRERRRRSLVSPTDTFSDVARAWYEVWSRGKSPRTAEYKIRRMEKDIFPAIGSVPIAQVSRRDVIAVIQAIRSRGVGETACRALQVIKQVLTFAVIHELREFNPISDLNPGSLVGRPPTQHFKSVGISSLPELLHKINAYQGLTTRYAMQLLSLTFVRTSELLGAKWCEFDMENSKWVIPPERMKRVGGIRKPHVVPLSSQARKVIENLRQRTGDGDFLFPGTTSQTLSNNTILRALERLGYKGRMTGHGFRSLASTVLHESGWDHLCIERQLAHEERNEVSASYNHAEFLKQRVEMMQFWGDFLESTYNSVN